MSHKLLRLVITVSACIGFFTGSAVAECTIPEAQFTDMGLTKRFQKLKPSRDDRELEAYAAHTGYFLGLQAQYLGDSAERREWYDCIVAAEAERAVTNSIFWGADPAKMEEAFQKGLYGMLDSSDFFEYEIDPDEPVTSMFAADFAGTWMVKAATKVGAHDFEFAFELTFAEHGDPMVTLRNLLYTDPPVTLPVKVEDITATIVLGDANNSLTWTLIYGEKHCTGSILAGTGLVIPIVECVRQ